MGSASNPTDIKSWRRGRDSFSPVALASPPKPAALTVIRFAHFSSSGGVRIGFESHVLFSLSLFSRYTTYEIRYTIHGGEGGIRTLGKALDPPHDFQSCTFDRSVTSPIAGVLLYQKLAKEQPKLRSSGMFSVKCFAKNQSNLHIIRILCKLQNQ